MSSVRRALAAAFATATVVALGACGGGTGAHNSVIEYWLWDSGQQPDYQKCADALHDANTGLRMHMSQYGSVSYLSKLTAVFIADTAADIFKDHLPKFAKFAALKVLRPGDE